MRLLVGGYVSMLLWNFEPSATTHKLTIGSEMHTNNKVVTSIASNSTIYPCTGKETALGPFFAAVGKAAPAAAALAPNAAAAISLTTTPTNSYVGSFWLDADKTKTYLEGIVNTGKIMYNNHADVTEANEVLILSRGNAIAWTDKGTGSLNFSTISIYGGLLANHVGFVFPQGDNNAKAEPGQILERDDTLYVIEPITRRVYALELQWHASTRTAVNPPTVSQAASRSYQFPPNEKPIRGAFNPKNGRLYVLTESSQIWEIDPHSANGKPVETPWFSAGLPSAKAHKDIATKVRLGGDIIWTSVGLVASTTHLKEAEPTASGDRITIVPWGPQGFSPINLVYQTSDIDIEAMTVSPQGNYLVVGARTSATIAIYELDKWQQWRPDSVIPQLLVSTPMTHYPPLSFAWLGECEGEKA